MPNSPSIPCRHIEAAASGGVVTEPWWERHTAPNMKHINSVQEFVNEMVLAPRVASVHLFSYSVRLWGAVVLVRC